MLQTLAEDELNHWLRLTKTVLSTSDSSAPSGGKGVAGGGNGGGKSLSDRAEPKNDDEDDEGDEDDGDDDVKFDASEEPKSHPIVAPRWPTRIFTIGKRP